jgi:hypothetical protein
MSDMSARSETPVSPGFVIPQGWTEAILRSFACVQKRPTPSPENTGENVASDNVDNTDGPTRATLQACVRREVEELAERCVCRRRLIVSPITKQPWCPTCSRYAAPKR